MTPFRSWLAGAAGCALLVVPLSAGAQTPTPGSPGAPPNQAAALEELTREYDKLAESLSGLQQELQQLRAEKSAAVAVNPKQTALDSRGLTQALKARIDRGELKVAEVRNRIVLTVPEKSLFRPSASKLLPQAKPLLREVAAALKALPKKEVQVGAHADLPAGKSAVAGKKAFTLSAQRAVLVVGTLTDEGIPGSAISAIGYGATRPIAPNFTGAGRTLNRRVEIVLVPKAD